MKSVYKIMIGVSFLVLGGVLLFERNRVEDHLTLPITQLLLPRVDTPLPNGEKVSLLQAQASTSYAIPLPLELGVNQVWISTNSSNPSTPKKSVAVEFTDIDLLLIAHEVPEPPDWDKTLIAVPELKKVNINGIVGIGTDPGFTKYGDKEYPYPGSVQWWIHGISIALYSDTLSLEELLKIAESVK